MAKLTEEQLELVRETAKAVMKEAGHLCHFDEEERKKLHAFNDVLDTEKADHGTLMVIVQFGKSIQNITRKAITWFIFGIVIIVAAVFTGAFMIK